MARLYMVARWDERFTCNQFNRLRRLPSWFPCPNRLDEVELILARSHPKPAHLVAAWHLMLRIASQSGGAIAQPDGTPHDSASLEAFTGFPVEWFQDALQFYTGTRSLTLIETAQPELHLGPIDTTTPPLRERSESTPSTLGHKEREIERQKSGQQSRADSETLQRLRDFKRRHQA